jgi:hypothetical protein
MASSLQDMTLKLEWVDFDEVPILFANHFLVQHQPNEFVVSIGQVTGPPVFGTPDQINDQLRQTESVPINTLARVGLTRHRAAELISVLQTAVEEHDRAGH